MPNDNELQRKLINEGKNYMKLIDMVLYESYHGRLSPKPDDDFMVGMSTFFLFVATGLGDVADDC